MATKSKPLVYTTKTQALSAHLAVMARKLGPGARLPTMQQLSEELGISVMTLNRALSELEAQGILVRRQGSGTYVTEKFASSIGVVCDRELIGAPASPFGDLLLQQAQTRANELGERFSLYLAEGSAGNIVHEDLAEAVNTRKITGALCVTRHPKVIDWLDKRIPVVALSHRDVSPYRVRIDHTQTIALGVEALAKKGCKNIALLIPAGYGIGPTSAGKSFAELEAYKTALSAAKLKYDENLVFNLSALSAHVEEDAEKQDVRLQGRAGAAAALDTLKADGIVSLDDELTLGALAEFNKRGVRAGHDVHVATHSNKVSHLLYAFEESLILIEVDPAEVAAAMFSLLETRLADKNAEEKVIAIAPKLAA